MAMGNAMDKTIISIRKNENNPESLTKESRKFQFEDTLRHALAEPRIRTRIWQKYRQYYNNR